MQRGASTETLLSVADRLDPLPSSSRSRYQLCRRRLVAACAAPRCVLSARRESNSHRPVISRVLEAIELQAGGRCDSNRTSVVSAPNGVPEPLGYTPVSFVEPWTRTTPARVRILRRAALPPRRRSTKFVPRSGVEPDPPRFQRSARHHESLRGASPGMAPGHHRHLFSCQRADGATVVRGSPRNRTGFVRVRTACFAIKA